MRHTIKRFAALAIALGIAIGTVGAVSAQTTGTVNVGGGTTGVLSLAVVGGPIAFGNGLNAFAGPGNNGDSTSCGSSGSENLYIADEEVVLTVKSTSNWDIDLFHNNTVTPEPNRLAVVSFGAGPLTCSSSIQPEDTTYINQSESGQQVENHLEGDPMSASGANFDQFFVLKVRSGDQAGTYDTDLTFAISTIAG
ncbi:MAG: hypothetical protein ACRDJH_21205 [Thermomicrobiales bacterium]